MTATELKVYSPASVPEGFIMGDPDHLKAFDIDALYDHWLKRQSKGLTPFVILKSAPQHKVKTKKTAKGKGKRKMGGPDGPADDDDLENEGLSSGDDKRSTHDEGEQRSTNGEDEQRTDGEEDLPHAAKVGPPRGRAKGTGNKQKKSKGPNPRGVLKSTSVIGPADKEVSLRPKDRFYEPNLNIIQEKNGRNPASREGPPAKNGVRGKKDQVDGPGKPAGKNPLGKSPRVSDANLGMRVVAEVSQNQRNVDGGDPPPPKRRRVGDPEPTPQGRPKRGLEDEEGPPKKKARADMESKGRESTRVKEYPAGNVATSSSRMAFLKSLCSEPQFRSLVDLVPTVVSWPSLTYVAL